MQRFDCARCGVLISFEDSRCPACGDGLAYRPDLLSMVNASTDEGALLQGWHPCAERPWGCNWLVRDEEGDARCPACRLNRRTPPRDDTIGWEQLARAAVAKRRLVHQLRDLGLPITSYHEQADGGLAFDLLSSATSGQRVVIGHANGVISVDLAESTDAHRESVRVWLDEAYRTMLGHFRHEIGHYYWQVLIPGGRWEEPFRALFGDERASYSEALQRHYRRDPGQPPAPEFITPYASSHPWEDFAEIWAHYLHITDTLQTAVQHSLFPDPRRGASQGRAQMDFDVDDIGELIAVWVGFAGSFNELNRSMGKPDPYPFTLSPAVVDKLGFVHRLVQGARGSEQPGDVRGADQ